jgi:hypothetical protein
MLAFHDDSTLVLGQRLARDTKQGKQSSALLALCTEWCYTAPPVKSVRAQMAFRPPQSAALNTPERASGAPEDLWRFDMFGTSLDRAVEKFAEAAQGLREPDLEREWAWGAYDSEGIRFAFFRTYEQLRDLAVKTATARATHGPAVSSAQRILAQYHCAYRDLQAALLGVGADDADRAPTGGEWSPRQAVAHIVGAEVGFYVVVKYALDRHRSGDGRPAEIPDETWDAVLGEDVTAVEAILDGSLADIRSYHETLHERVLREFAEIGEDEMAIPSRYWEGYPLSLRFRLHRFDSHLRQHAIQVDKTLAAIGLALDEAQRLLRLIYAALAEAEGPAIGAWGMGEQLRRQTAAAIASRADEIAALVSEG